MTLGSLELHFRLEGSLNTSDTINSLDGLEGEHLGEVVDQSFIGMTSWFSTRNQSKHMYKVHRHIDMKHVVTGIYKQNSSTLFFFFFSR